MIVYSLLLLDRAEHTNPMPMVQALEKIRDICTFALGTSNQNQAMISSTHDMIPDGPKVKHCKPRRRGGMSGYMVGASSGVSSYFSPTPSASMGHNDSPLEPHDSPERDVEPLVTPLPRDSLLPELHDNLQLEMIEIDTITGSREASPSPADSSMLNVPCVHPPANQDSSLMLTDVKTSFSPEDDAQVGTGSAADDREPVIEQENLEQCPQNSEQPQNGDTNGTHFLQEDDPTPHQEVSTFSAEPIEVTTDVNGVESETKSIPKPPEFEAENQTPPESTSHGTEDIKPYTHPTEKSITEPSPTHQDCSGESMKIDPVEGVIPADSQGKRKEPATDKGETASTMSSPGPDNSHDYGKSPFKSSPEGESRATESDSVAAKDNVQRKYKRLRRSAPKQR